MMSAPTAVLCPIDFSEPSRGALRYAAVIAAHVGASLTVLTVNGLLLSTVAVAFLVKSKNIREL